MTSIRLLSYIYKILILIYSLLNNPFTNYFYILINKLNNAIKFLKSCLHQKFLILVSDNFLQNNNFFSSLKKFHVNPNNLKNFEI